MVQPQRKDSGSALTPSSEPSPTIQSEADRSTTAQHQINVQDKKLQGGKAPLDSATTLSKAAPVKELKGAEEAEAGAGAGSVVDLRPGYAAQPKAAEPPPPLEGEKSADLAMNRSAKREDQDRSRDAFKNQSDNIHGPNRAANNAPTSTTSQRVMSGARVP